MGEAEARDTCPYAFPHPGKRAVSARVRYDDADTEFAMIVGYDDVKLAARDWRKFTSDTPGRVPIPHEVEARSVRQLPLETDPPAHTLFRAVISDLFSRTRVGGLEPHIRSVVSSVLDRVVDTGQVEVVEGLATPVVMGSLAKFLGRPQHEADEWATWGRVVFDTDSQGNKSANPRLDGYLAAAVDGARSEPGEDFFGVLARARIDGEALSRDEMLGFSNLVFVGGRGTLIDSISSAVWYLGSEPTDRAKLVARPEMISVAVEEFFRYFSPLAHIGRTATENVDIGGTFIRDGGLVSLGFALANHDPGTFDDAETCVIERKPNRHVAFGHGPHTCVGAHLARIEMRIVVEELLLRAPNFEVETSPTFRSLDLGFVSLPAGLESLELTIPHD